MFKRIFLFILTNVLVLVTISIVMSLLGIHGYLTQHGIDYKALMIFCALWGMGGAFISLLMSRWIAKKFMGVRLINRQSNNPNDARVFEMVERLAQAAGLNKTPEVGIFDSPEPNAFATGARKNASLVAVSTGLLQKLSHDEVEAVIGHEITHITNGDMVTMTLIQGVVNAFALFLSRIAAYAISTALSRGESNEGGGFSYLTYMLCTIVFDILFTILGSLVTAAFSRWREFRADAGGAKLAGTQKMISALKALAAPIPKEQLDTRAPALAALKISSHKKTWLKWFMSHPPIEQRIARLEKNDFF